MTWAPTITREAFAQGYAQRSGTTVEWLAEHGRAPRPCNCRESDCEGWMMAHLGEYDADVAAWLNGDGPHPGHLGA